MPIIASAKKAHRASLRKHVFNLRRKREMLSSVKEVKKAITTGNSDGAEKLLPRVYKAVDKAVKRGIIKKNTASRTKSRLVAAIRRTQETKKS
ncbi:MAG TPA: 30S ribosomal protein S20 [Candidatus Kaiserbacteria bacterium]|nr:30S ribosomal protein S20 [Candidatus Kaiserbacteria bacterium]